MFDRLGILADGVGRKGTTCPFQLTNGEKVIKGKSRRNSHAKAQRHKDKNVFVSVIIF